MTRAETKARRSPRLAGLRERAEALLMQSPQALAATPGGEVRNLVHELRVHQVELEMQNDELRRVQLELENSRDRFARLYDLAPVGYLTLDATGVIREANLTAARLLGLDRQALLHKKLSRFVAAESQDHLYLHCQQVFATAEMRRCDLQMHRLDGAPFSGRLETIAETAEPGQSDQALVALSDVTRLLQAEALLLSESNYRALFEQNPSPMLICDENTLAFLDVNQAALTLYGWSRNEFLQLTAKDIRPPEDVPSFLRQVKQLGNPQATSVGEWRHLKRNGSVFDVAVTVSSISYAGRAVFLVLVRDITERKQAQAALRESENRYRRLFEDALTGDFLATPAGKVLLCNPAFVKIYGFSSRGRAERGNVARFNPHDWACLLQRLRTRRKINGHQSWHKAVNGRQIHIVENLVGLFNDQQELIQVKGYVFDNTERKFAEDLLKQLNATLEARVAARTRALTNANQRLQAIMDAALNGIITLDERGMIDSLNPSASRIFGYAPNEIVGRNISRLLTSPRQAPNEEFLAHYLRASQRQVLRLQGKNLGVRGEVLGQRKDGQTLVLDLSVAEFTGGGQRKLVAMVRDITQQKRLERELLDISERERRQLGRDLHDGLGQHLHGLAYLAELLEKDLRAGISPRTAETGQLSKHLREALEMTRSLAQGLQPVKSVPQGLMMALRELADRARVVYRLDCRFLCHSPVLIHRHSAANHLYRIAQEAMNNAMKHGKPTRIRIQLNATPAKIALRVRDNGVGIRRRTRPGPGMGLHVMQYRADSIRGSLLIQRHPEGGTEVLCTVGRQALLPQENDSK